MSAMDKLNFFVATYGRMVAALFNVRLWPPYLIYFLISSVLIFMIISMFSTLLAGWFIPILMFIVKINGGAPELVLHYPQHLAFLPFLFEQLNILPALFIESLFNTALILMFAAHFRKEKVSFRNSLRESSHYYLKIVLVWLISFVLAFLLYKSVPSLFREFIVGSPRREMAMSVGMKGLSVLLTSLFVYVLPYLVIRKRSFGESFTRGFRLFFRNFFTTYFFVAIPQFIILPLIFVLQNTGSVVEKFNPQVLIPLTFLLALLFAIVNYFVTGSIVRFFLEVAEE